MLKTGIVSSAYFKIDDYKQGLEKIKSHGYDCIDYQGLVVPENPLYKLNGKEFDNYFEDLKKTADSVGINIWQMHAMWPHDDTTKESREQVVECQKKAIRAGGILGIKYFVIHPAMPCGWSIEPDLNEAYSINEERFTQLIPIAKDAGVTICLENMPFGDKRHSFSSVKDVKNFVTRIGDDSFKACLDTGHSHVTDDNLYDSIIALGKDLKALHVHDTKFHHDLHLFPYQGELDWDGFILGLSEIKFDGCISLETSVRPRTPEPIKEQMQIVLSNYAKYIAKKVSEYGKNS